jgi:hypothetical protein
MRFDYCKNVDHFNRTEIAKHIRQTFNLTSSLLRIRLWWAFMMKSNQCCFKPVEK